MNLGRMETPASSAAGYKKRPGTGPGQFGKEGENVIMLLPVAKCRQAPPLYHFFLDLPASAMPMALACFSDLTTGPFLDPLRSLPALYSPMTLPILPYIVLHFLCFGFDFIYAAKPSAPENLKGF